MENPTKPAEDSKSGSTGVHLDFSNIWNLKSSKWRSGTWYRVRNRSEDIIELKTKNLPDTVFALINPDSARVFTGEELEQIGQEFLHRLEREEKIVITELDHEQNKEYTIVNLTSKRITIKHNAFEDRNFFVPALGSRNINGKTLLDLDYTTWESQGLIQVEPMVDEVTNSGAEAVNSLTITLLGIFLLISIPMAFFRIGAMSWKVIGIVTVVGVLVIAGTLLFTSRNNREFLNEFGNSLKLVPGIMLVVGLGFGLPAGIIFLYGDGQQLLQAHRFELASLGRFLQAGFISIASMLPAFLFYLFGRQQVTKQRENFYREAMLLDPNVWSKHEAKNKYGPLLNSVYDTGNSPFSILLLIISTALLINGWIIALSPIGAVSSDATDLIFFFTPDRSPFTLGFLGVYFFTVNLIYRRYIRSDLTPKTYAYITMRLLITVVLVWAISTLPQFSAGSLLEAGLSAIAFMIGIFPESGLTLMQDYFNKTITKRRGQDPDVFALTKLEGMNLYDQARLLEEGIENIENLAHHNLMELIARTRIPTARLVDMFDQSILYLHLGSENQKMRGLLKNLGIRTATDLLNCKKEINDLKDEDQYKDMVKKLQVIIPALKDDEWLNYIRNWRESTSLDNDSPIDDPYLFYYRAIGINAPHSAGSPEPVKEERKTEVVQPIPIIPIPTDTTILPPANENPVN